MYERPGRLADHFPPPFKNDSRRARATTAVPPDLSVIAKARGYERGFPWFVFDLFTAVPGARRRLPRGAATGYEDAPTGRRRCRRARIYNKYFPGHVLAMPPPLTRRPRRPTPTARRRPLDQYSKDVTAFLMWAAEPHMEARKRIGLQVMIFLHRVRGAALLHQEEGVDEQVEATPDRRPASAAATACPLAAHCRS